MRTILLTVTFITLLISCNPGDDTDSFISDDPKEYNDKIKEGNLNKESWTEDPVLIVRQLFRSDDFERKTIIDLDGDSRDKVTIVLTQEGLGDDSVYGERRIFRFERSKELWTIVDVRVGFRCQTSRGHDNYSGDICS